MRFLYICTTIIFPTLCFAQKHIVVKSQVISAETRKVLSGAIIKNKGGHVITDSNGFFKIYSSNDNDTLTVSFLGYNTKKIVINKSDGIIPFIVLEENNNILNEVFISTGYQRLPKERSTGSFVQLNNDLLNRRVSTNILDRIQDVTSGLIFNKGTVVPNDISIRGQNTIFSNAQPLIIIDNFPYEGNLSNVNPNDIESITILKDAAAASIWGARAGNGVIVITTKVGKKNQPLQIALNSNLTMGEKPDLFYSDKMTIHDFINLEKKLFADGFYASAEASDSHEPLSPIVELLIKGRDHPALIAGIDREIEAISQYDIREDYKNYLYRTKVNQQHALSLSGGGTSHQHLLSLGFDQNSDNLIRNGYKRFTLNSNNSFELLDKRLTFTNRIYYTQSKTDQNNQGALTWRGGSPLYPYARIKDENGTELSVTKNYRSDFSQDVIGDGLLNWEYNPLLDIRLSNNNSTIEDYRFDTGINYKIIAGLSADLLYQYGKSTTVNQNLHDSDSYFTRDLINNYTQINLDGTLNRAIPLGSILDQETTAVKYQNFRSQINFDKAIAADHIVTAIAGFETRIVDSDADKYRKYGYNTDQATSKQVDYVTTFKMYYNPIFANTIPFIDSGTGLADRFLSYYTNLGYSFMNRYYLSASARMDKSNIFGVNTNQKGIPLYSIGAAWDISKEKFYTMDWLPVLKLRTTLGYNGNVNKSLSAYTTAFYYNGAGTITRLPYAQIANPPNPELRWEKIKSVNFGVDFESKNGVISGSIEYYQKTGIDLIGTSPIPSSTGNFVFSGNVASTKGNGFDIVIKTKNLNNILKWHTNFLFSHSQDEVTAYTAGKIGANYLNGINGSFPVVGKPLHAISGYKWAGIDPTTGDPLGFIDGMISNDWNKIVNNSTIDNVVFKGSARPLFFGAIRNTFIWKDFMLSANISYRFKYYFFKESVNYSTILNGAWGHGDYTKRWQKTGDESTTNIPSLPPTDNYNRNEFFKYSEPLIEKGDHIRFQDIKINYSLKLKAKKLPFQQFQIYLYVDNVGILWKATNTKLDPDYQNMLMPRTYAIGVKIDL